MQEATPWTDGTKPDENGDIKKQIDAWLKRIIGGFTTEPVIPCKGISGHKTSQDIVTAQQTDSAYNEHLLISVFPMQ